MSLGFDKKGFWFFDQNLRTKEELQKELKNVFVLLLISAILLIFSAIFGFYSLGLIFLATFFLDVEILIMRRTEYQRRFME